MATMDYAHGIANASTRRPALGGYRLRAAVDRVLADRNGFEASAIAAGRIRREITFFDARANGGTADCGEEAAGGGHVREKEVLVRQLDTRMSDG